MDEEQYKSYFENLAISNKSINHTQDGKASFFYIENGDDLDEFDNALRNAIQSPVFMLVADEGEINDNASKNYTHELNGQFYVVARKTAADTVSDIRKTCFEIIRQYLAKIRKDSKENQIVPGKLVNFRVNGIPYHRVGPMNNDWYGYTVFFQFTCPFSFSVDEGNWR